MDAGECAVTNQNWKREGEKEKVKKRRKDVGKRVPEYSGL